MIPYIYFTMLSDTIDFFYSNGQFMVIPDNTLRCLAILVIPDNTFTILTNTKQYLPIPSNT
jgi:hypothetical protein